MKSRHGLRVSCFLQTYSRSWLVLGAADCEWNKLTEVVQSACSLRYIVWL